MAKTHSLPGKLTLPKFLLLNGVGVLAFPFLFVIYVIATFGETESGYTWWLGLYVFGHAVIFCVGLGVYWFLDFVRIALPWAILTVGAFIYNWHVEGAPDHSPFSDGLGIYDKQVYGLMPYFHVFDEGTDRFGTSYLDMPGLLFNIEFCILLGIALGAISWWTTPRRSEMSSNRSDHVQTPT